MRPAGIRTTHRRKNRSIVDAEEGDSEASNINDQQSPRLLLLLPTTTYRTEAFVSAARQMDVEVTVGSEQPNALARLNPTAFLTLDFHDPDQAARQVSEFAATYPIHAVVPVDDEATLVGAAICQRLSLRHNSVESVRAAGNKHSMRLLFDEAGVPSPGFTLCRLDAEPSILAGQVRFPCVVKPLELSASQGVIRADNESQFVRAVGRLTRIVQAAANRDAGTRDVEEHPPAADQKPSLTSHFLVEDFISGPEVALEGLVSLGVLQTLALFDKPDLLEGPFFEETIYVTPSRLEADVQKRIVRCTSHAIEALGLSEGAIHAEIRLGTDGPSVIEVNARSIGGQCSHVLRFGTGMSLEELIIRHALDPDFTPPQRDCKPAGVMMLPIPRAGRLTEVRGVPDAESVVGIERVSITAHPGQELLPLPEGSLYPGFLFARASSPAAVEAALREAHSRLEFLVEPSESRRVKKLRRP
jgi:biotin carboxylase